MRTRPPASALALAAAALAAAAGCTSAPVSDVLPDLGPRSSLTAAEVDQMKAACTFTASTLPGVTLPKGAPLGPEIPIDTVVIVMMENRSFDHLLSDLPAAGQADVEVATTAMHNADSHGKPVAFHHLTDLCFGDTNHEWDGSHLEYGDGKNDGFVVANESTTPRPPAVPADGERAMGFYDRGDMPFLYSLATTFAIADHYHASLLGPTYPNRDYLYAATSWGHTQNDLFTNSNPTLFSALNDAGIEWREYAESLPGSAVTGLIDNAHLGALADLAVEAATGKLPPVVFVDPDLAEKTGGGNDDLHPPGDVQLGDQFLDKVIATLVASPQWPHMAVFVTFDENGGIYDHVAPPAACPPDGLTPIPPAVGKFDRLGFRVPFVAVSPYAKAHYVSHRTYDHSSIVRFVESRFLLPALTARDANADPLYDLFDFSSAHFATAPALTHASVDQTRLDFCKHTFTGQ